MSDRKVHDVSDSDDEISILNPPTVPTKDRKCCPHGSICYRDSADHVSEFGHPSRDLHFYLTKCYGPSERFNPGTFVRSLKDILHENIGDTLESAVHFSYIYEMEWLLDQYPKEFRKIPMLLVVQQNDEILKLLIAQRQVYKNVFLLPVPLARFGTHHTKMISLKYKNSLRIVVTTANLYETDWTSKTQMIWVSPVLKRVDTGHGKDANTGFRSALCDYLRSYNLSKLTVLAESYRDYDFSSINDVFFVASTPHSQNSGLRQLKSILKSNVPLVPTNSPLTFSFSSIGTLGVDDEGWLRGVFGEAFFTSSDQRTFNIRDITPDLMKAIYPTTEEVRNSLEGYEAGRSLPYTSKVHHRQRWLTRWLHNWKSDRVGRTKAAPHVKFYIRTSADYKRTFWFLMTSANLSKAAWGNSDKAPLSYEAGILHVPKRNLQTDQIVLPFDLPPKSYSSSDKVWLQDNVYTQPDLLGHQWDPRRGGCVPFNP